MCGGTYRVSVYGPPPGSPGLGHGGAISTCQPWCVTADINTDNVSIKGQYKLWVFFKFLWPIL